MAGGYDVGTGASLTFATSGFLAKLEDIDWSGIDRGAIEKTTHQSTLPSGSSQFGGAEFVPNVIFDGGELSADILFDPNNWPPINQAPETVTLTFKLYSGDSTAATISGTAYLRSMGMAVPVKDGMMKAPITLKWSGVLTVAAAT